MGIGILLVLVGIYFVLVNVVPGFRDLIHLNYAWPVTILLVGAGFAVLGLFVGAPDLAVPAALSRELAESCIIRI
jgi:hypothetical protein